MTVFAFRLVGLAGGAILGFGVGLEDGVPVGLVLGVTDGVGTPVGDIDGSGESEGLGLGRIAEGVAPGEGLGNTIGGFFSGVGLALAVPGKELPDGTGGNDVGGQESIQKLKALGIELG